MNHSKGIRWGMPAFFILCCLLPGLGWAQSASGEKLIEQFISEENFTAADSLIQERIALFTTRKQWDSLASYPEFIGKVEAAKSNAETAVAKSKEFIETLKQNEAGNRTLYKAYISLNDLYIALGDDEGSVVAAKEALDYAEQTTDITGEELGRVHYVIGGNYYALYELDNAISYFRESASAYESDPEARKDWLSDAYNGVAVSMWTLNKLDSANVYYDKAIAAAEASDLESYRRIYYINAFKFNQALVVDGQGKLSEAIVIKQDVIKNLQKIIDESPNDSLVDRTKWLHATAISNLATFYHDTGYLTKAYEMLKYAYKKKEEVLEANSPRLVSNLAQIATSEFELREFDKSIASANRALEMLKELPSDYLSVEADVIYAQARAYEAKGDIEKARELYEESEAIYKKAYPDDFSREYIVMLRNYALFLAQNGEPEKAISLFSKAYEYVEENDGKDNITQLSNLLTLSEVHYRSKNFAMAEEWAQKANEYLNTKLQTASSQIDSIQVQYNRPAITLLEVQSKYQLEDNKDVEFLIEELAKIDQAVKILEQRKTTTFNLGDINSLLAEYKKLNGFAKQLSYDLYELTGDESYLEKIMSLQESGIYNRIRTKFNIKNDVAFADIPNAVFTREKALKNELSSAMEDSETSTINTYFEADAQWNAFKDSLEQHFPKYYNMRYGSIIQPLDGIQKNIPAGTIVVRYLFIGDDLYAFVVSEENKALVPMASDGLSENILALTESNFDVEQIGPILYTLYEQLWKPIENKVSSEKIIIVPDGILFNLSFETLTSAQISSFQELATTSLLAKHDISYNYSLLLMNGEQKTIDYSNNFVAFAPQFTEKMKEDYEIAITDSASVDKTYLSLIPQPFSADIAKEYSKRFSGDAFLNEKSTKQIFTDKAREHKIIHIGTHAESNNISPELSRLIFAKDADGDSDPDDNYLYTYEIYNQNLSSNLAILTACETGKPTYQAGEGMISLAHAFNYAGSESILTSLWKIDEESSAKIIESFYEYLSQSESKDAALRKAKLDYLATAQGRTAAPQYWAGLVLMGDAQPIELKRSTSIWYWIAGLGVLVLLFVFLRKRKAS